MRKFPPMTSKDKEYEIISCVASFNFYGRTIQSAFLVPFIIGTFTQEPREQTVQFPPLPPPPCAALALCKFNLTCYLVV